MKYFNKDVFKYWGLIILSVLLITKLPHDSFSIIQYSIPPITFGHSMIQLAGLVPLIMYIVGIKGLLRLEYFAGRNKTLVVLGILFIITPLLRDVCEFIKVPYYQLVSDVRSIELEDSHLYTEEITEKGLMVNVELELIDYSNTGNEFSVILHFPKSWESLSGQSEYKFKEDYHTRGHKGRFKISEQFIIPFKEGYSLEELQNESWYRDTYKYELQSKSQAVTLIVHGV